MRILHNDDAIRESFQKVKEHIRLLEKELRADREFIITLNSSLELINKRLLAIEDKLKEKDNNIDKKILEPNQKPKLIESLEEQPIMTEKNIILNSGIVTPQEIRGYLATRRHSCDTLATPYRNFGILQNIDLEELKADLNKIFLSLTNREFKVFSAIYTLEEQNKGPATYYDLAQFLDLSSSSIRDYISELIRKGTPISKEKTRNGIVYVSISKEFRSLNLMSKLLALRSLSNDQKSLFDSF